MSSRPFALEEYERKDSPQYTLHRADSRESCLAQPRTSGFAIRQNRRWGCRGIMPLPGVWGREAPDTSAPCQMGEHGRRRAKPLRVQRRAGLEADLEAGLDAGLDAGARVASARARMVLA